MANEIQVERQVIDGLDFTFVTKEDTEVLRGCVVLPFEVDAILDGTIPCEAPHVLEHVICCGDGSLSSAEFKEQAESLGGYSNARTVRTINGMMGFETTQPDDCAELVRRMIRATFHPAADENDLLEQRIIVRNELNGKLHDPIRQRMGVKGYQEGRAYATDGMALESLDSITLDDTMRIRDNAFTRRNARIVLTGRADVVYQLADSLAEDCVDDIANGQRIFGPSNNLVAAPDFHAPATEIPAGMTDYFYFQVSDELLEGVSLAEFTVAADAFYSCITAGRYGMIEQSRNRGLSYGVNVGLAFSTEQVSVSVADTTSSEYVPGQIELLAQSLGRAAQYDPADFDGFRRKRLGTIKMYPEELLKFAGRVEDRVARRDDWKIISPQAYRQALEAASPDAVATVVQDIANRLQQPSFMLRSAFGDNPFIS